LIFVHEMGHGRRHADRGHPGGRADVHSVRGRAFVAMHGARANAAVEARVAMAGPLAGSLAAWAVLGAGLALEQRLSPGARPHRHPDKPLQPRAGYRRWTGGASRAPSRALTGVAGYGHRPSSRCC